MKQQTKLIGILVILIALLAGAFVLYQNLSKKYKADTASEETSSVNDTEEQEAVSDRQKTNCVKFLGQLVSAVQTGDARV